MSSSDGFVPVFVNLNSMTNYNEVILIDKNTDSFEKLAAFMYQNFRHRIPEEWLANGERTVTKMWVQWNPKGSDFLPRDTQITSANIPALLRLMELRGGVDMIRLWLNEVEEAVYRPKYGNFSDDEEEQQDED